MFKFKSGIAMSIAGIGALASSVAFADPVDMWDGQWRYSITPYAWIPTVNGSLKYHLPPGEGGNADVKIGPNSYLKNLQFVALVAGEVRKGDIAFVTDFIYIDFANLKSHVHDVTGPDGGVVPIDSNVNTGLKSLIWESALSYTAARNASGNLDVFGGFRYAGMKSTLSGDVFLPDGTPLHSGNHSETVNLWDGIVGVRGALRLGDDGHWYMPYELDVGAGSSNWSWQGNLGVGYRFGWGDVLLSYRNLSYTMNNDKLVQNLRLTGPVIGVKFDW